MSRQPELRVADVDGASLASFLFRALQAAWLERHTETPCVHHVDGDVPAALASLGCDAQLAVLLDLEGLTAREIGDVLGCPSDAARSRLGDARRRLRELLWARR